MVDPGSTCTQTQGYCPSTSQSTTPGSTTCNSGLPIFRSTFQRIHLSPHDAIHMLDMPRNRSQCHATRIRPRFPDSLSIRVGVVVGSLPFLADPYNGFVASGRTVALIHPTLTTTDAAYAWS
jgi:hypothetical protein